MRSLRPPRGGSSLAALPALLRATHLFGLALGSAGDVQRTYPARPNGDIGWVSPWTYGLNQGPIVLMIENHRSGFFWDLMKRCPPIREGLRRAGFTGRWLSSDGRRE